ncbi:MULTISPECIES: ribosome biogenesis GTPase Der [Sulfurimonas]|uniref:GTPase Der n=1 Tax=Sulfurimonas diazotrophicus TaxID=3131939 RepID=A0ABZ3HD66_9BACT
MKKLAIIGRPNVGKSSFFNRLLKERDAITSEMAGTTRDVKKRVATVLDREVEVLDTGGLDEGSELFDKVREKSIAAAKQADIILFMVDGKNLPIEEDKKLFHELEAMGKSMALVVNKIDNDKMKEKVWEYYEFGTQTIFGISVSHNRSINPLLEWIAKQLPYIPQAGELEAAEPDMMDEFDDLLDAYMEEDEEEGSIYDENDEMKESDEDPNHISVAIIGRVNVGKSSLLNALLGEERSVVSDVAGTTIDPIDETIERDDKTITFIDTAGIRKRGKIEGIERYALYRTRTMLERANLALLVLDASEPFRDLDEKIAGLIDENRLACMIVLNKWDKAPRDDYDKIVQQVRDRFKFLHYAPVITVSALTKQRIHKLYDMIIQINDNYSQRITTSRLNEALAFAMRKHPIPSMHGQVIRLYYATQYATRPPQIALIMNKPKGLHFTYRRFLANQLREAFNFEGTPLLFKAKKRGEK